jgi:hypothetical protein
MAVDPFPDTSCTSVKYLTKYCYNDSHCYKSLRFIGCLKNKWIENKSGGMRMQNVCRAGLHGDVLEHCVYDGCPALFVPSSAPVFCFSDRQTDTRNVSGIKKYNPWHYWIVACSKNARLLTRTHCKNPCQCCCCCWFYYYVAILAALNGALLCNNAISASIFRCKCRVTWTRNGRTASLHFGGLCIV